MDKIMNKDIEAALKYASNSMGIEDLKLTEEEKEKIKEMIKKGMSDGSFLYTIVNELKKKEENGKTR